jgi:hypothetical protein
MRETEYSCHFFSTCARLPDVTGRGRRKKGEEIRQVFWHEVNRRGLPRIVLRFAEVDGRAECVRVEIGADVKVENGADFADPNAPDPVPLQTQDLRRIALQELIAEARRKNLEHSRLVSEASTWLGEPISERQRKTARRALAAAERDSGKRRGMGRPGQTDLELARRALVYTQADSRNRTQAVMDEFQLTLSQAAKSVHRARAKGLLSSTKQRQAGGRLTAKARALLEEAGELPKSGSKRKRR